MWERSGHTDRGRDGCRVPLPWTGNTAPFGFSPEGASAEPWLPQPSNWGERSVEAQTGDETSMLELYRTALNLRREHAALGDGNMNWLDAPAGVLAFRRDPGFACVVNLSTEAYQLPEHATILLASGPVTDGLLEPDRAVWLKV
jgi:alpha-glucosidase